MVRNGEYWVTRDYGGEGKALTMSKATLGLFLHHLLKVGGQLNSIYAMDPTYDRSYVQAHLILPTGQKERFEQLTGIALERPPTFKLN